jgi:hypothetical protein
VFYIAVVWFASALISIQWFLLNLALCVGGKTFPYEVNAALAWAKMMTGQDPLLISFAVISVFSLIVSYCAFSRQDQIG